MSQRAPPDSEVRSSIQSIVEMPFSAALSFRPGGAPPLSSLGPFGLGRSARGSGGLRLAMAGSGPGDLAHAGARRVDVLADAVERHARVAWREALELGVDAEARADLEVAVAHA